MGPLRGCAVALAPLATLALAPARAPTPHLHWHGGDVFGVFEWSASANASRTSEGPA